LKTGTLEECLNFNVESQKSVIRGLLYFDDIELPVEGVVIKKYRDNHKPPFVTKKKSSAFIEMERGKRTERKAKTPAQQVTNDIIQRLCENRMHQVISKIGDTIEPNPYRIARDVFNDAVKELEDDADHPIHKISKSKLSKIQKKTCGKYTLEVKKLMNW
jgi:hypothetical protein